MKEHYIRLFNYDRFASGQILRSILDSGSPQIPVKLMAHLLVAQQRWLNRCKGINNNDSSLWPDWEPALLVDIVEANSMAWINYLEELQPSDMHKKVIHYQNTKGESFDNQLVDVLAHVINHGTHHRAQAGQHLKAVGVETLPVTDYIFYIR